VLRLDQPVALEPGTPLVVTGTDETGRQVSQVAVVGSASAADGETLLTLTAALDTPLDPASVVVLGNVVAAGHGRTVAGEVLGSGDGTAGYQRFALRHNDVSTAPGGTGNSLTVRVDGVRWTQRPTLYGLGPADRAYAMWIDAGGTASVLFGDGTAGARLPTGTENVIAGYRSGSGPDGNVRAGTLTLLLNRPLGIRSVDNPVPATGGTPPEPAGAARTTAPRSVQTFDRVVSLADHEQFAAAFPGIAKATAVALAAGRAPYVHLTVAGPDGAPVPATTVAALRPALDAAGRWGPPPVVANCRRLGFTVGVTVTAAPDRAPGSVAGAVRAALLDAFSFGRRSFAEPVAASQVVAVVQAVPGVCSALLTVLTLSPAPDPAAGPVAEILTARPARPASDGVLPAEILVVDADRITVTEVPR
jgi:predicted phage baseplate assembly protein